LRRGLQRIDWTGIGLLTVGLTSLQIVLERGQEVDWFASSWIASGTVVAVLAIVALLMWELKNDEPLFHFWSKPASVPDVRW
jgi:MFS transporter, DHA2 family, multidrug resistance protein